MGSELASSAKRQLVDEIRTEAMSWDLLGWTNLTLPVSRILQGELRVVEVPVVVHVVAVPRPDPTALEIQPLRQLALGFHGQPVVLVSRAVSDIKDIRQGLEWTCFVNIGLSVRNRGVVVVLVGPAAHSRSNVGDAEARVPLLPLNGEVILQRVRRLVIRVLRWRETDARWPAGSSGREHPRENHLRVCFRIR